MECPKSRVDKIRWGGRKVERTRFAGVAEKSSGQDSLKWPNVAAVCYECRCGVSCVMNVAAVCVMNVASFAKRDESGRKVAWARLATHPTHPEHTPHPYRRAPTLRFRENIEFCRGRVTKIWARVTKNWARVTKIWARVTKIQAQGGRGGRGGWPFSPTRLFCHSSES